MPGKKYILIRDAKTTEKLFIATSQGEAARMTNNSQPSVSNCCYLRRQYTSRGFSFEFIPKEKK